MIIPDFDIAGAFDPMLPAAECVKMMAEIFTALGLTNFEVRLNHRKKLDGIFEICGVPEETFRAISSAVDKLDKCSWEEVRKEMIEEKGLDPTVADSIHVQIGHKGRPEEVIAALKANELFMKNENTKSGLESMEQLFNFCLLMGLDGSALNFDLSLARGLDYYTGVIYEAVLVSKLTLHETRNYYNLLYMWHLIYCFLIFDCFSQTNLKKTISQWEV